MYKPIVINAQQIRQFREKHGITQEKLAQEMGVSHRTILRWEAGHNISRMGIETLRFHGVLKGGTDVNSSRAVRKQ